MRSPLDVLHDFSVRRATPRQTMAALIAHDGWLVPMSWALSDLGCTRLHTLYLAEPATVPAGELWCYTSPEALTEGRAQLAAHHALGCYAGPVRGVELFERLPDTLARLEINPGLAAEHRFFAQHRALGLIRELARTRSLERALDTRADDLIERLLAFGSYQLLVAGDAPRFALSTPQLARPLAAFTSREACAVACTRERVEDPAASAIAGDVLFRLVERHDADGIALIGADGACTYELDRATCEMIVRLDEHRRARGTTP